MDWRGTPVSPAEEVRSIFGQALEAQIGLIAREVTVMSPATSATTIAVLTLVVMVPQRSFAGAPQAPVPDGGPRSSRVRCLDPEATRVFKEALATSPTVTRMVERLQDTDLIVVIEAAPLEKVTRGQVRIVAAVAGVRYLRIRLTIPLLPTIATSVLGHELQHALEIAAMPEVCDEVSLWYAYRRIGFATRAGGYFETEAALATGERVADEAERAARSADIPNIIVRK